MEGKIWKTPDWCVIINVIYGLGESLETGGNNCKENYTKGQCDPFHTFKTPIVVVNYVIGMVNSYVLLDNT